MMTKGKIYGCTACLLEEFGQNKKKSSVFAGFELLLGLMLSCLTSLPKGCGSE
jgi:hypothetical protein